MRPMRVLKNPWFIGMGIILVVVALFYSYGLWLLSDASPYIYNELYPTSESRRDTVIVNHIPIYMSDTLYIGNNRVVTHKEISLPQSHIENINENPSPTAEQLGVLGDSAGLWNALFSALALIGVIITIVYQIYKDGKSEKAICISRFRDEFYRLLDCLSNVVIEIEIRVSNNGGATWPEMLRGTAYEGSQSDNSPKPQPSEPAIIKGRACFKFVYAEQPNSISAAGTRPGGADYETLESQFADHFSHYFRLLYRLLRYIDSANDLKDISDKNKIKEECFGILKAHLSTFELLVIFYNGLLEKNYKAKILYEKAKLFDNLNVSYLTFPNERQFYEVVKQAVTSDDIPKENQPSRYYNPRAFVKLKNKPFKLFKWAKEEGRNITNSIKTLFKRNSPQIPWDEKIYIDYIGPDDVFPYYKLQRILPFKDSTLKDLINRLQKEGKLTQIKIQNKTYYKRVVGR